MESAYIELEKMKWINDNQIIFCGLLPFTKTFNNRPRVKYEKKSWAPSRISKENETYSVEGEMENKMEMHKQQ